LPPLKQQHQGDEGDDDRQNAGDHLPCDDDRGARDRAGRGRGRALDKALEPGVLLVAADDPSPGGDLMPLRGLPHQR
jgi:hypothetical protein